MIAVKGFRSIRNNIYERVFYKRSHSNAVKNSWPYGFYLCADSLLRGFKPYRTIFMILVITSAIIKQLRDFRHYGIIFVMIMCVC